MTARCQVCHGREAVFVIGTLRHPKMARVCGPRCEEILARRQNALSVHVALRSNDWPEDPEWREFAALVCDHEMAFSAPGFDPEAWESIWIRRSEHPLFGDFWNGLCFGYDDTHAARLGRLIAERRAGR